jgi:hypothetical protein
MAHLKPKNQATAIWNSRCFEPTTNESHKIYNHQLEEPAILEILQIIGFHFLKKKKKLETDGSSIILNPNWTVPSETKNQPTVVITYLQVGKYHNVSK